MDTSVHKPPCFALFDPLALECVCCGIRVDCMKEQEKRIRIHDADRTQPSISPESTSNQNPTPSKKEKIVKKIHTVAGDEQFIPEHTRKPLEIPPVGVHLQAFYRGRTYRALVVSDPTNPRFGNRSILYDGTIYKTLTAAAHAIAPGINSGTVWQAI